MFLAGTYEVGSTDIDSSVIAWTSEISDDLLGAELYTNDTQQGIRNANYRPPTNVRCCEWFNEHAFYANGLQPYQAIVSLVNVGTDSGDTPGISTKRTLANASWSSSSTVITADGNIDSDGLAVGQILHHVQVVGSREIPADAEIVGLTQVSVGPDVVSITINKTTTGASSGQTVEAFDQVNAEGVYFLADDTNAYAESAGVLPMGALDPPNARFDVSIAGSSATSEELAQIARNLVFVVQASSQHDHAPLAAEYLGTNAEPGRLRFYNPHENNGGSFTFTWTNGYGENDGSPSLTSPSWRPSAAAVQLVVARPRRTAAKQPGGKNVVWISKFQQPDAVPILNSLTVGAADAEILRVIALRESLFIFKEDGLFRLVGFSLNTFSADEFDLTSVLVAPDSPAKVDNKLYYLSEGGVVRCSDAGVEDNPELSRPIKDKVDAALRNLRQQSSPTCFGYGQGSEYTVWLPAAEDSDSAAEGWILNTVTGGWTGPLNAWPATFGFVPSYDEKVYLGKADSATNQLWQERDLRDDTVINASQEFTGTIDSISNNTVTLTGAVSGWTPAVGDLIEQSGNVAIITSVASSTVFDVDDPTGFSAAAVTGYVAVEQVVEPRVRVHETQAIDKWFQEASVAVDSRKGIRDLTLDFLSNRQSAFEGVTRALTREQIDRQQSLRYFVPRNQQLGTHMRMQLKVKQAGSQWRLWGIRTMAEPGSEATERG